MDCLDIDEYDQIFTHTDLEGITRHFNATALWTAILKKQCPANYAVVDLFEELVEALRKNHGIDTEHLKKVAKDEKRIEEPILVVHIGDDQLIIDGSHRVVARWDNGKKDQPAVFVDEPHWHPFLITGFGEWRMVNGRKMQILPPTCECN